MMEPNPPPSRIARPSANRASSFHSDPIAKEDNTLSVESALHDMADMFSRRIARNFSLFVNFLGSGDPQMRRRILTLMICAPSSAARCAP